MIYKRHINVKTLQGMFPCNSCAHFAVKVSVNASCSFGQTDSPMCRICSIILIYSDFYSVGLLVMTCMCCLWSENLGFDNAKQRQSLWTTSIFNHRRVLQPISQPLTNACPTQILWCEGYPDVVSSTLCQELSVGKHNQVVWSSIRCPPCATQIGSSNLELSCQFWMRRYWLESVYESPQRRFFQLHKHCLLPDEFVALNT